VTPCSPAEFHQCFSWTYYLHLHIRRVRQARNQPTRRHTAGDSRPNLHLHLCENLRHSIIIISLLTDIRVSRACQLVTVILKSEILSAPDHEEVWESGALVDVSTTWRCVVSFKPHPLCLRRRSRLCHLNGRLGGPRSRTPWSREKFLAPAENQTPAV
jgi:hypothetical protein